MSDEFARHAINDIITAERLAAKRARDAASVATRRAERAEAQVAVMREALRLYEQLDDHATDCPEWNDDLVCEAVWDLRSAAIKARNAALETTAGVEIEQELDAYRVIRGRLQRYIARRGDSGWTLARMYMDWEMKDILDALDATVPGRGE